MQYNKIIHILASKNEIVRYTLAPVIINKYELEERGYNIKIFYKIDKYLFDCDILCLISKPTIKLLNETSQIFQDTGPVIQFIKKAKTKVDKLIWMDDSDSTSVTHFEILPMIDRYLKKQLFKDYSLYRKELYGGRLFSDYYHTHYNVTDKDSYAQYYPLKKEFEHKLCLSWNIGLGDVYNAFTNITKFFLYIKYMPKINYDYNYVDVSDERKIDILLKTSVNLSRETIAFHRKELLCVLNRFAKKHNEITSVIGGEIKNGNNLKILDGKENKYISTKEFRTMMSMTKIMPSPFGWGEIGVRDYEAFIFGALLLKPDMSHMNTWPNIFIQNETYIAFKWDYSDLHEKIDNILSDDNLRVRIASCGQETYKTSISKQGMSNFCDWFEKQVVEFN